HTAGVLLLGLLVSSSTLVAPERLYPWLGAAAGGLLVAVGATMLLARRRDRSRRAHVHGHGHHDHGHDHDNGHRHGGRWHTHTPPPPDRALRPASLLAVGFVGGLLPSPSALVVLLGAIALGRTWFGVLLVVAYGTGMALTLAGAGLLLVRGRVALDRRLARGRRLPALLALESALPAITAVVI